MEYITLPGGYERHSVLRLSYVNTTEPIKPQITNIAKVVEENIPNNIPTILISAMGISVNENLGAKSQNAVLLRKINLFIKHNIPAKITNTIIPPINPLTKLIPI